MIDLPIIYPLFSCGGLTLYVNYHCSACLNINHIRFRIQLFL
nr:MAG TPA: Cytochrome b [Caudoviricetes sp.]